MRRDEIKPRRRRWKRVTGLACVAVAMTAAVAYAMHAAIDTEGHTTLEQTIAAIDPDADYTNLNLGPGDPPVVRDAAAEGTPAVPPASAGRAAVRQSLAYFAQFTDFQLADEESPARVEFLDPGPSSAHRPQEALTGYEIDYSVKQVNEFAGASPITEGGGTRNSMDFTLLTGDNADNNQRNESVWVRELMEGGTPINFNSGSTDPTLYNDPVEDLLPGCGPVDPLTLPAEPVYTGVQDYDDYAEANPPLYYDPDDPRGQYAAWPTYTGLMDRAQALSITPVGLDNPNTGAPGDLPSYVTNGNHDVLVQGNEDAVQEFERIAVGCEKILASTAQPSPGILDPNILLQPPSQTMTVARDPDRRFVSRPQIRAIFSGEDNDHGFGFVDPVEAAASTHPVVGQSAASYYAWDPPETPGFRFISIDTNSEGGQTAEGVACGSSNGNIDDPQFQWLDRELQAAQAKDQLIVIYGHHPVRSMCSEVPDENAAPCTVTDDGFGTHPSDTPTHDVNPGCDLDPRISDPIHLGEDPQMGDPRESFVELLDQYPNVIAYVAGHTHENNLQLFPRTGGASAWWGIETSAVVDWPTQSRLIEVMDNRNDSLSVFGTLIDHASDPTAPGSGNACGVTPSCADGDGFDANQLSSIGRTLAYNDPQGGPGGGGEGADADQNAELLLHDPRESDLVVTKTDDPSGIDAPPEPDEHLAFTPLTYTVKVTNNDKAGPPGEEDVWDAEDVTLTDDIPTTADFVSATPTQGTCTPPVGEGDLVCALGDLAPGATATVTIVVTPQTAIDITNRATATSVFDDPTPNNATDVPETTRITPNPAFADVEAVSKTDSPDPVTVGDPLTYSISVRNNGAGTADGAAVIDQLPAGVIFSSATSPQGPCELDLGTVTCEVGDLASGDTASVQIVVLPQVPGTLTNQASVASGKTDPTPNNNSAGSSTQVVPRPDPATGTPPAGTQGPAAAGRQGKCAGVAATIVGTSAGETITGTPKRDVIAAGSGDDMVLGANRNDLICGKQGDDDLFGGRGRDILIGGPGNDRLAGGKGRDRARGKGGNDFCRSAVTQSSC
jgi:uncharacterized repeat protein (TIGR01451 family)